MVDFAQDSAVELLGFFLLSMVSFFLYSLTGVGNESIFMMGYFSLYTLHITEHSESTMTNALTYLTFSIVSAALVECATHAKIIWHLPFYLGSFMVPCMAFAFFGGTALVKYDSITFIRLTGLAMVISSTVSLIVDRYYGRSNAEQARHRFEDANEDYFHLIDTTDDYDDSLSDGGSDSEELSVDPLERLATGKKLKKKSNKKKQIIRKSKRISQIMLKVEHANNNDAVRLAKYDVRSPTMFVHLTLSGVMSGIMGGLFGIYGLPLTVFSIINDVELRVVRTLSAVSIAFGLSLSYVMNLFVFNSGNFEWKCWPIYTVLIIGSLLGILIGDWVGSNKVEQKTVRQGIYATLFCGGLGMILFNLSRVSLLPAVFYLFFNAGLILYIFARMVEDATFAGDDNVDEVEDNINGDGMSKKSASHHESNNSIYQSL